MRRFLFLSLLGILSCSSESEPTKEEDISITYTESAEDFPNPERGFYHYSETYASNFAPLSLALLKNHRDSHKVSGGSYTIVSTLLFRYYVLDLFKNAPLSNAFLQQVTQDFETARAAGVKLIPRFTYTIDVTSGSCPEGFICPPYGDAPKAVVLGHISQLKPVLKENADVIAAVQTGFIGTWGENYYTDYFGDASSNGQQKLLDENWNDRIEVLNALLDAVPDEIMVQVRYPQFKQRAVYGINAPVTSAALTETEGFSGSKKARIGFHNDCFLASSDDFGTYEDYGNSSSPRTGANTTLRKYFAEDSKYVVVGGETCSDGYSPQNNCSPEGKADDEMRSLHYSYLNSDYNNQVNNDWVDGGCMENIKRNLGYRFVLKDATFSPVDNKIISVRINLENVGYASPYNPRPAQLVLRNKESSAVKVYALETDVRRWFSGTITVQQDIDVNNLAPGNYELLLNFPDSHASIQDRPEYSIRLANDNVWEAETGYNSLQHTITIK